MASEPIKIDTGERREAGNCDQHGAFEGRVLKFAGKEIRLGCPVCMEERKQRERAEEEQAKASEERRVFQRRLGDALIPLRFQSKHFDGYSAKTAEQKKALNVCKQYAEFFGDHYRFGRCLILAGKVGTGKTHLACAIANELITTGKWIPVYRTVSGLLQYIKGSYDNRSEYTEAQAFENLVRPHLLIIDEVGATKTTEFELATLFNVINGRYEQQKPTIIVTNLKTSELADAIGERSLDRLREGGGIAAKFEWSSARAEVKA